MKTSAILTGYALLLLVGLPLLASRQDGSEVDVAGAAGYRRAIYASIAVSLLLIAGATLAIAVWQGVEPRSVGWLVDEPLPAILWAVGVAGAGLAIAWAVTVAARRFGLRESPLARLLMPTDSREKRAFLLLSGVGAVCEEYVYRGFLLHVVTTWTGRSWVAVGLTALSFGLAHGYQRLAGISRAMLLGAVLAIPVVWSSSLFPAIVAHFWINAAIGLGGWRLLLPEGAEPGASVRGEGENG